MGIQIKFWALLLGIAFFFVILRALKKNVMKPSYSVLWAGIAVFLVSIPVLESVYKWFAVNVIGIEDARHIIYIALIIFLLFYVFYLTRVISRVSDQVQRLLGMVAILESQQRSFEDSQGASSELKRVES